MFRCLCLLSICSFHLSGAVFAASLAAGFEDTARGLLGQLPPTAPENEGGQVPTASLGTGLSQAEIAAGLKQALNNGTRYAVDSLGQEGGFLDNPTLRIPLPTSLAPLAKGARQLGQGKLVDDLVVTLNRAAEQAVPETAEVFDQAIAALTIEDAMTILQGEEDAATEYFKNTRLEALQTRLLPIVQKATNQAGVSSAYKALQEQTKGIELGRLKGFLGGDPTEVDLDRYITNRSVDALFQLIAEQERIIRRDALARGTDLLRKVFGE